MGTECLLAEAQCKQVTQNTKQRDFGRIDILNFAASATMQRKLNRPKKKTEQSQKGDRDLYNVVVIVIRKSDRHDTALCM